MPFAVGRSTQSVGDGKDKALLYIRKPCPAGWTFQVVLRVCPHQSLLPPRRRAKSNPSAQPKLPCFLLVDVTQRGIDAAWPCRDGHRVKRWKSGCAGSVRRGK